MVARNLEDNKTFRICFDMGDGKRILAQKQLQECDWYFKRSFYESIYSSMPQELRSKILPYGLNYVCTNKNGLAYKIQLALRSAINTNEPGKAAYKESLKLVVSTLRFIDKKCYLAHSDFEVEPNVPAHPKIVFQTRVWDPQPFGADAPNVHKLNDFRAKISLALRTNFGADFIGGLQRTSYAIKHYSDCLSPHSDDQIDYLKTVKDCLIGVSTIGLHNSTPWKLAEYLAASRCIISERLNYELPVRLQEDINYLTFSTPEECVTACEKVLNNPGLIQKMRLANWIYYQEQVKPDALIWRCLRTVFPT